MQITERHYKIWIRLSEDSAQNKLFSQAMGFQQKIILPLVQT